EHGFRLSDTGAGAAPLGRAAGRIVGARLQDVGMEVDDRPGIAQMAALRIIDASHVVFGRRGGHVVIVGCVKRSADAPAPEPNRARTGASALRLTPPTNCRPNATTSPPVCPAPGA